MWPGRSSTTSLFDHFAWYRWVCLIFAHNHQYYSVTVCVKYIPVSVLSVYCDDRPQNCHQHWPDSDLRAAEASGTLPAEDKPDTGGTYWEKSSRVLAVTALISSVCLARGRFKNLALSTLSPFQKTIPCYTGSLPQLMRESPDTRTHTAKHSLLRTWWYVRTRSSATPTFPTQKFNGKSIKARHQQQRMNWSAVLIADGQPQRTCLQSGFLVKQIHFSSHSTTTPSSDAHLHVRS